MMYSRRLAQMTAVAGIALAATALLTAPASARPHRDFDFPAEDLPRIMPDCDTEETAETPESSAVVGIALVGAFGFYKRKQGKPEAFTLAKTGA